MKAVITGIHGTIGSALARYLKEKGHQVVGWDRSQVSITDYWSMTHFLKQEAPDVLYHLAIPSSPTGMDNENWMVTFQWTSELAWICKEQGIDFIFSSTVMVFSDQAKGPFTPESRPDAGEGYGMEKRLAEDRVFFQNRDAKVIRLGWQISPEKGSNNMVDWIETKMASDGVVACSTQWLPACSFLEDTVVTLEELHGKGPGIYQFDSNEKWSFYQIVFSLNQLYGKKWRIIASDSFVYDQRMYDTKIKAPSLKIRIPSLK